MNAVNKSGRRLASTHPDILPARILNEPSAQASMTLLATSGTLVQIPSTPISMS